MERRSIYTMKKVSRFLLDVVQVIFLSSLFVLLRPFSFNFISNVGGALGRSVGMRLPHRRRAYQNLKRAMPELSPKKQNEIVAGMFENLGRTFLEYIALPGVQIYEGEGDGSKSGNGAGGRVEVIGKEIIDQLRDDQKPAVLFLAHLANWEIGTLAALQRGVKIAQVYRKPNYPSMDTLPCGARGCCERFGRRTPSCRRSSTRFSYFHVERSKNERGRMDPFLWDARENCNGRRTTRFKMQLSFCSRACRADRGNALSSHIFSTPCQQEKNS
jgi:Bacterial lipid A biosynthesis acyltransferase